jgi:lipopolysaccharide export LptBFGC system permease protein LptF
MVRMGKAIKMIGIFFVCVLAYSVIHLFTKNINKYKLPALKAVKVT